MYCGAFNDNTIECLEKLTKEIKRKKPNEHEEGAKEIIIHKKIFNECVAWSRQDFSRIRSERLDESRMENGEILYSE